MSYPELHNYFLDALPALAKPCQGEEQPDAQIVVLNEPLAAELGLNATWLRTADGIQFLLGRNNPPGTKSVAMGYAGHQFGQFNPQMGDGRALLLGEVDTTNGVRDLHVKGAGLTPWSRPGSDGRGALGPMLREYAVSEFMHAVGVPTSRALAVMSTGRPILRQGAEPGGVVVRVASSHLRVGTMQYAQLTGGPVLAQQVADFTIERHYPALQEAPRPRRYVELFEQIMDRQCATVAAWMRMGFIHGVMNTDNTTLSGETLDYGPCAFMEDYDPATVFSSIDHQGRYAYGTQPDLLGWNLARLAEAMLPLFDEDPNSALAIAQGAIDSFAGRYESAMRAEYSRALGVEADDALIREFIVELERHSPDVTLTNRALNAAAGGDDSPLRELLPGSEWVDKWLALDPAVGADVHPVVIPRNRQLDGALKSTRDGNMQPYLDLLAAVTNPFAEPADACLVRPDPAGLEGFRTFCGT